MERVSVDLTVASPYIEKASRFYRLKRFFTYRVIFRLIGRCFGGTLPKKVLEIGIGSGFFLSFAKVKFPSAEFTGFEYDQRLIDESSSRAPFVRFVQGNAEKFDLLPERFDLIVSLQVVEHLYEPPRMLSCVLQHLSEDGIFILTTPNLCGLGAKLMGARWQGFRSDHVSLKGIGEWAALLESSGFEILYSGSTFFSGIPAFSRLPLVLVNWLLLILFGSFRWRHGESCVFVVRRFRVTPL